MSSALFQYCQKIAVFSQDETEILLARRKDEADYNGVFSFIGGKMEHRDASILDGLRREKNEEVGENFTIGVLPYYTVNTFFVKKDGSRMILPHYYARHISGEPVLNEEYSEYRWIKLTELRSFSPKIENINDITPRLLAAKSLVSEDELVTL